MAQVGSSVTLSEDDPGPGMPFMSAYWNRQNREQLKLTTPPSPTGDQSKMLVHFTASTLIWLLAWLKKRWSGSAQATDLF